MKIIDRLALIADYLKEYTAEHNTRHRVFLTDAEFKQAMAELKHNDDTGKIELFTFAGYDFTLINIENKQ